MRENYTSDQFATNDSSIRIALIEYLTKLHARDKNKRIIEELGVQHGNARMDVAVVNGIIHGYEIKSDRDTLDRLSEQVIEYNTVFDKITLVVGKNHLYKSMHLIPDWWGVMVAKQTTKDKLVFQTIRDSEQNKEQKYISIARLLWKNEVLGLLKNQTEIQGLHYKTRDVLYKKLLDTFSSDTKNLKKHVNSILISRKGWRSDVPQVLSGDLYR